MTARPPFLTATLPTSRFVDVFRVPTANGRRAARRLYRVCRRSGMSPGVARHALYLALMVERAEWSLVEAEQVAS